MLTQEQLKELLHYDPETGVFTARLTRGAVFKGVSVGGIQKDGYIRIGISKKKYYAHRLAWFYVHGRWPSKQIDHINCQKIDNSIGNLREATASQNKINSPLYRNNTCGKKGAFFVSPGKWRALIGKDNSIIHLGYFDSADAAQAAYAAAASVHYGEFARAE
jgi:hypothetical protein